MHPSDDRPRDSGRFTARPRRESELSLTDERTQKTLDDMRVLYTEAQEIVDEGTESFFADDNLRTRRAATALIIHLSDAAHRPEIEAIRAEFSDVDWDGLRQMWNHLGHKYHDINFQIVWNTLSVLFPRERKILGLS